MESLNRFDGSSLAHIYFFKAAAILKKYCRKPPNNLSTKDRLDSYGQKLYLSIYNDSILSFVDESLDCSANMDIMMVADQLIKLVIDAQIPTLKLSRVIPSNAITHFLKTYCQNVGDSLYSLDSNPQIVFNSDNLC